MTFADRLRAEKERKGISWAEVAELADINVQTVYGYLHYGHSPSLSIGSRIADAFGVTLDYLAGRDERRQHGN